MIDKNLGTKRLCPACHAKFYDLNKSPAVCPKCGEEFVPKPILPSRQEQVEAASQTQVESPPAVETVVEDVAEDVAEAVEDVPEVALEEAEDTPVDPEDGPFLEDDASVEDIIDAPVEKDEEEG